jgi:hypothetical protein
MEYSQYGFMPFAEEGLPSRSILLPQLIKDFCLPVWTHIAKSGSVGATMSTPPQKKKEKKKSLML